MIAFIRRAILAAITPAPVPPAANVVPVRSHVRAKPVNPKTQALHDELRAELGR